MDCAYSTFQVKDLSGGTDDDVVITGIASTPIPDRDGDMIDPAGITFRNPIPLLLHHDRKAPVGTVTLFPPTADGLRFEARLPRIKEEGALKTRIDEAIHSLRAGVIRGASIGYAALVSSIRKLKSGGSFIGQLEVCELSLVTVPSNREASVITIKSIDARSLLIATDQPTPGVTGPSIHAIKDLPAMTDQDKTADQIKSFRNTRQVKQDRMTAIMASAGTESVTLDDAQSTEYETLNDEVKRIDVHLTRLADYEKSLALTAKPIEPKIETAMRQYTPITVKANVPLGTAFVRYVKAYAACNGNRLEAAEFAKQWQDSTPEVALALKAAVAAGNTTDSAWAKPLVPSFQSLANEFIEIVRPATILGRLPDLRKVPFNVTIPVQTLASSVGWVGEGAPKPVSKLGFGSVNLGIAKAAGIVVLTEELVKLSSPAADEVVKRDLTNTMQQFLDAQFIDPAVAAVANVSPGSITNGAGTAAATTNPWADMQAMIQKFIANGVPLTRAAWIMSQTNAFAIGLLSNAVGQRIFELVPTGGTAFGLPVVTSEAAKQWIILVDQGSILYADDGGVDIAISREASIQMDSAPDNPALATTVYESMFQMNKVAVRAERFVNWARVAPKVVEYLTAAAYVPASPVPTGALTPPPTLLS